MINLYPDFRKITGNYIECLIFDFDGYDKMRTFPKITNQASLGTLYYVRLPQVNKLEIDDDEAIISYVMFLVCYLGNKNSALNYYNIFADKVKRIANSYHVLQNTKRSRGSLFF